MSKNVFWVVARLPQRLKSTLFEIFSILRVPFGHPPFEKISNNVDFSLWGKQCICPAKMRPKLWKSHIVVVVLRLLFPYIKTNGHTWSAYKQEHQRANVVWPAHSSSKLLLLSASGSSSLIKMRRWRQCFCCCWFLGIIFFPIRLRVAHCSKLWFCCPGCSAMLETLKKWRSKRPDLGALDPCCRAWVGTVGPQHSVHYTYSIYLCTLGTIFSLSLPSYYITSIQNHPQPYIINSLSNRIHKISRYGTYIFEMMKKN